MEKIILSVFIGCLLVLGCSSCNVDKAHSTYYTYINNTASTITIECYYGGISDDEVVDPNDLYKTHTILPRERYTIAFYEDVFCWPLDRCDYLLVKNEKVKVYDAGGNDSLLYMETYTLTSASDTERYYEYIFTNDYFKNGKPIE